MNTIFQLKQPKTRENVEKGVIPAKIPILAYCEFKRKIAEKIIGRFNKHVRQFRNY